jgi:hypothetical protein
MMQPVWFPGPTIATSNTNRAHDMWVHKRPVLLRFRYEPAGGSDTALTRSFVNEPCVSTTVFHNAAPQLNLYRPGWVSRYSDGLQAGQPGFDSRPGQEIFL